MANNKETKPLIEWEVPEYIQHEKGIWWFIVMGGGSMLLFIYAIWTLNFLFAVIIIIIAIIVYIHERREPDILKFQIMPRGIQLDKQFIPFKEINRFWIIYEPPEVKNLYFHVNRTLRHELSVPLMNINPVLVRRILLRYLYEDLEEQDISTDDEIGRILKI